MLILRRRMVRGFTPHQLRTAIPGWRGRTGFAEAPVNSPTKTEPGLPRSEVRPRHPSSRIHLHVWLRKTFATALLIALSLLGQSIKVMAVEPGLALTPPSKTSWASFRHDLAQTGVATCDLPETLEKIWEVSLGEQILATAAIVGDFVYVPCLSGELVCLRRKTGEKVWAYKTVEKVAANNFAPGFKSSPTVTANAIYLGDEDGIFHAIDRATGKGLWKFKTGGEIYSSAAVFEGRILFGSYDNNLYCLNADGTEAWKFGTQGYVHCAPAVVEGVTFIAGCDEHLRTIDVKTGEQRFELKLDTYLIASPALVGEMLYVGTFANEVVAVDWKKQKIVWRYQAGNGDFPFHSSAAVTDKLVVLGGRDKFVHAIDRETGKKVWTFPTRSKVDSSPTIVGNRVFIGSNEGNLYELNLADGKERWKFNAGKAISAAPAVGEGVLVIGSESRDGKVYCFGKK